MNPETFSPRPAFKGGTFFLCCALAIFLILGFLDGASIHDVRLM